MTDFPPFSQLLSRATVQALQMRCLTFSRVNWLRNGKLSKAGEYIWRTLYSSQAKLIGEGLLIREHVMGYLNLAFEAKKGQKKADIGF